MPRFEEGHCTVCRHPQVAAIDVLLDQGESLRAIAGRFAGLSKTLVGEHKKHRAQRLADAGVELPDVRDRRRREEAAIEVARVTRGLVVDAVSDNVRRSVTLIDRAERMLERVEGGDKLPGWSGVMQALAALQAQQRADLELLARLTGELGPNRVAGLHPDLAPLIERIGDVLQRYPEARALVAEEIRVFLSEAAA